MSFERQSEKEPLGPAFLEEQIRLPRSEWDERFRNLIEEKIQERQLPEEVREESPEREQERSFERYLKGLGLNEDALKDKKILDLGSGDGEFVRSLIEKGITKDAYGIDVAVDEITLNEKFKGHLLKSDFEHKLPVSNADYVVSVGAVSLGVWGGDEVMNIPRIIEHSLAALNKNGEIRIYPLQEAAVATPLEGLEESSKKWQELITKLSKEQNLECTIVPRNVKVIGDADDIMLQSVLVIKKNLQHPAKTGY